MLRTTLLLSLALPVCALASDRGQITFQRACAQCHVVTPTASSAKKSAPVKGGIDVPKGRTLAPELGSVMRATSYEHVRAWVKNPHAKKKDTGCTTQLVEQNEIDDLMAYLSSAARPPLPERKKLLEANLETSVKQRRVAIEAEKKRRAVRRPPPGAPQMIRGGKKESGR